MESPIKPETITNILGRPKTLDDKLREKYESFWLYPPSHSMRLGQHVAVRGVMLGATFGLLGGVPYSFLKKGKGQVLSSVGKIVLRSATVGGLVTTLIAAERLYHLDTVGIEDRAYRISYNWGQTKWDYFSFDGGLLGAVLLRRPLGGVLPAAAVGVGLGSLTYIFSTIIGKAISS